MTEPHDPGRFWRGRSVLVTGGTSFTAYWLLPELIRRDAQVIALVRRRPGRNDLLPHRLPPGTAVVEGAVTDCGLLRGIVDEREVETIIHLAAQSLESEASQEPAATLDVNVRGAWSVLEAARVSGQCQVLIASSGKIYGGGQPCPLDEDAPVSGNRPYEASKVCAELLGAMYAATYAVPTGILRCGNLFGGGDLNWSRSIPGLVQSALRGERFVIRGDGRTTRDYLYIEDAVDGYVRLAEKLAQDRSLHGQAFNIGLGRGTSVLELSAMVLHIAGRTGLDPVVLGAATGETPHQYLNSDKARRLLQWSPRHSIEEGLRKTVSWYRQHIQQLHGKEVSWSQTLDPIGA